MEKLPLIATILLAQTNLRAEPAAFKLRANDVIALTVARPSEGAQGTR